MQLREAVVLCVANRYLAIRKKIGGPNGFDDLEGNSITPLEKTIVDEEFDHRIETLPTNLREIAKRLIVGFTPREIAGEFKCSIRSIELRRKRIYEIWKQETEID